MMSDFNQVAMFVETLPKNPDVDAHRLKDIAANAMELEKFLYAELCSKVKNVVANMSIPSRRANESGLTTIFSIDAPEIVRYVNGVQRIKMGLRRLNWKSQPMPQVPVDLSFFSILGSLKLEVSDAEIFLNNTTFNDDFHLVISNEVTLSSSHAVFKNVFVNLIGAGYLNLYLMHPSFQGEISILGSTDLPRKEMSVCVQATPGAVVAGDVTISDCALLNFQLDGWHLQKSLEIANCDLADFSLTSTELNGNANFSSCNFVENPALFLNAIFQKSTKFDRCKFDRAPDFHGAKIHQNTKFLSCQFLAAGAILSPTCDLHDVAAYRVLKGHFSQQKDSRQETVFYALEQRAERHTTNRDFAEVAISWFQDAVSSYGQSLSRALCAFLVWNAFFAFAFQLFGSGALKVKAVGSIERFPGIALSLQNAFNPLALFSEKGIVELHSLFLYFTSLVQALGSLGILALIFLTIRGKFRKGSSSEG